MLSICRGVGSMRESRNRGKVFFFGVTDILWCNSIEETDQLISGYVVNGDWYLKYDKLLQTKSAYTDHRFSDLVNVQHDIVLIKALGLIDERKTDRDMGFIIEELKTKIRATLREID